MWLVIWVWVLGKVIFGFWFVKLEICMVEVMICFRCWNVFVIGVSVLNVVNV